MFSGKRAVLCHLACGKGRTARVVSCHSVVVTDTTSSPRTDCDRDMDLERCTSWESTGSDDALLEWCLGYSQVGQGAVY